MADTSTKPIVAKGLQISPIRQELHVSPGGSADGSIVVANLTDKTLNVNVTFQEFSVIDTNYDYSFQTSHYNWVAIPTPEVTLKPQESKTIPYTINPDKVASPGGYYFTIFASANYQSGGVNTTLQAASLLYTTVNGTLNKGTELNKVSLPSIIISPDITYSYTTTDTGNVYYTIYTIASLSNVFDTSEGEAAAHVVLPQAPRLLTGSLPAPKYPGLYTATIGYRTDSGNIMTQSKTVLYIPLWGFVVVIAVILIAIRVAVVSHRAWRRRRQMR